MAGLRERQKADRNQRILSAAVTQFRADGYHSVRIEDIAEIAGVSVGTVYNYYQTKGDILIAAVALEVEEVLQAGSVIIGNPPSGADNAIMTLIFSYYDHSLKYLNKEMWRSAMALSIDGPETPQGRRYGELDRKLADQVTDLIIALQQRGDVKQELPPAALGGLLFNNLNMMFIEFVKDDAMSLAALRTAVAVQTGPLTRLIATGEEA
jgi:AcrR family transcriptional regulator